MAIIFQENCVRPTPSKPAPVMAMNAGSDLDEGNGDEADSLSEEHLAKIIGDDEKVDMPFADVCDDQGLEYEEVQPHRS